MPSIGNHVDAVFIPESVNTSTTLRVTGGDLIVNTNDLVVDESTNRVGIGTNNPEYQTTIAADGPNAKLNIKRKTAAASNGNAFGSLFYTNSDGTDVASVRAHRESANDDAYLGFSTRDTGGSITEKLRIESTGGLKFTGQGTSIPIGGILHHTNNHLYIRGGTSGLILSNQDNTNTIQISESDFIKFETTDGTEKLRVTSSGDLLSQTGGSVTYDDITGASNAGIVVGSASYNSSGVVIRTSSTGTGRLYFGDNSGNDAGRFDGYVLYAHNTRKLALGAGGATAVWVDSSQNVGIGTNDPQSKLDINGTNSELRFYRDDRARFGGIRYDGSLLRLRLPQGDHLGIYDSTEANLNLIVKSTGEVGVGTIGPDEKLHVVGGSLKLDAISNLKFGAAGATGVALRDETNILGGSLSGSLGAVTMAYLASAPSSPVQGQFYFNSLSSTAQIYTGSSFVDLVPSGGGGGGGGATSTDANATFRKYTYSISSTTNSVTGSSDTVVSAGSFVVGHKYTIKTVGTTTFTDIGASANTVGTVFTATGVGSGTGDAYETLFYSTGGDQNVEVYVNGVKAVEGSTNDYVATSGTSVNFVANLASGDVVDIQVYELLTNDAYVLATGGTFTGNVGINTSTINNRLHIHSNANEQGILLTQAGDNYSAIISDANRGSADKYVLNLEGKWNGNKIARISFETGNDTTNKDDGRIKFSTSPSGGNPQVRMHIAPSGNVGIGLPEDTDASARLEVRGTGNTIPTGIHKYSYAGSNSNSGIRVIGIESAIDIVGENAGQHGSSLLLRNENEGFGFYNRPDTDSFHLHSFTSSANDFSIHAGGAQLSAIVDLMSFTKAGLVGIGTTDPGANLQIEGHLAYLINRVNTANTYFRAENTGVGNAGIKMKNSQGEWTIIANDRLRFVDDDSNAERLSIASSGNVGIGTNNPQMLLQVGSRTAATPAGMIDVVRGEILGGGTGPRIRLIHGPDGGTQRIHSIYSYVGDLRIAADSNENMEFHTGGGLSQIINSTGNVGIGTNNPTDKFTVHNANTGNPTGITIRNTEASSTYSHARLRLESQNAAAYADIWADVANSALRLGYNSSSTVNIDSVGRLFVGGNGTVASSSERLTVRGMTMAKNDSTSVSPLYLRNENFTANTKQPYITFQDGSGNRGGIGIENNTSAMWISGQTGIIFRGGTSSPGNAEWGRFNSDAHGGTFNVGPDTVGGQPTASARFNIYGNNQTQGTMRIEPHSDKGNSVSHIHYGSNGDWYIRPANNSSGKIIIADGGGNVGIGIANPTEKLYVNGTTRIGGGVDYGSTTVLSVAPGTIKWDTAGVVGGKLNADQNGNWYLNNKSYPVYNSLGVNMNDIYGANSAANNIGGWVYLGSTQHSNPYPRKVYKISAPDGNQGTFVYQVWFNGDANYDYGGLYEIRINNWNESSRLNSVAVTCINGQSNGLRVYAYNDTNGIWITTNSIWGSLYIRKFGYDDSRRSRGSTKCAVDNGGPLASADVNGTSGTIPSGYTEVHANDSGGGGYDIENNHRFQAGQGGP